MNLKKLPSLNLPRKESFDFNLPVDYVTSKFYEFGYKVVNNKASGKYNSCCPICREGKSWGRKKRCWYDPTNGNISCFNCGSNLSTYNWIREVSGMTHQELSIELELGDFGYVNNFVEDELPKKVVDTLPIDSINLFDVNQVHYYSDNAKVQYALNYIRERRLDTAVNRPDALYISLKDRFQSDRLVIPFKDVGGDITFFQTRKLFEFDDNPTYLSKLNADKTLYGINKVDPDSDTVFLFEGPIDSFFIRNGLGVAGITKGKITYTKTQRKQIESLKMFDKIWCLDSQWLDKTSRDKTISLLEMGECVFIWPKKWGERYKDLNELCIDKKLDQISPTFIKNNSQCGKSAILMLKMMFKD
jgi:hypothetical protein